jgi:Carbohydrate-selective porin, OprB family
MSRIAQRILFAVPAAYAASLLVSTTAFAAPVAAAKADLNAVKLSEVQTKSSIDAPLVAKSDALSPDATEVQPSDWQYSALQGLANKYDCDSKVFSGQSIARDAFVDGLKSCLNKVEPLVAKGNEQVSTEELDTLRRLTQEFRAELSNIDTRIEKVQQRTALAQTSQFSTTTKLKGEVVIGLNGVISGGAPGSNTTVSNRARLLLESTFTGKDKLYTRLNAQNNGAGYGTLRNGANLTNIAPVNGVTAANGSQTTFGGSSTNAFSLDWLAYQFPVGNATVYAGAFNGIHSDYAETHNAYFQDFTGGSGAISSLAEENPIYKIGGGTGVGVTIPLNGANTGIGLDSINLSYFGGASGANSPAINQGIFGSRNSILAQINFKPSEKFDFGLAYVNANHNDGAIYDFGSGGPVLGTGLLAKNSNSFGVSASYKVSDSFTLNGYLTSTSATGASILGNPATPATPGTPDVPVGNASVLTYGIGAAFPNIGQPGNLLGFFVGQPPTVTNVDGAASSAYHIEGFYKYKLNDNLSITPGLIYLTNPNQLGTNSTGSLLGTVRTTFTF